MFHRSLFKTYLLAFIILVLCLLPSSSLPKVEQDSFAFDKLVHFLMYVPLAWTMVFGFKLQTRFPALKRRALVATIFIASFYGSVVELLQLLLTPDRYADWFDLLADVLGVLGGIASYKFGRRLILWWNKLWG